MLVKISKIVLLGMIAFGAFIAGAGEKVVWDGDSVGKSFLWKKGATAVVENGKASMAFPGNNARAVSLSWTPKSDGGVKLKDYKNLVLDLKVEGKIGKTLKIRLIDANRKKGTPVSVVAFCPGGQFPGEATTVKIPVSELQDAKFGDAAIVGIFVSVWTKDKEDVKISLDRIAFE